MGVNVKALHNQLLSIKKNLNQLRGERSYSDNKTNSIIESYAIARGDFERLMRKARVPIHLRALEKVNRYRDNYDLIEGRQMEIEIECDKAIGALAGLSVSIPEEELDKLKSLRKESESVSRELDDINYEKNVTQAIDEYETGHTLASALISSRVIIYALDKIPGGKEAEEKVKFLDEKKIIDKKGKDPGEFILKANKKARNFFSHDIKAFPDPSDALSLLGDSIAILRIICKLEKASKS